LPSATVWRERAPATIAQAEFTDFRRNFRERIRDADGARQCTIDCSACAQRYAQLADRQF
jgi:hypothetical protein